MFVFYHCCLMFVSHFVVVLDTFFSLRETKKVVPGRIRQVVVLYSNDCMGICLGRLSIGHLDKWSSCAGGRLNGFDYIS